MFDNKLKINIWASTLGADVWALCRFLDGLSNVKLRVYAKNINIFKKDAVWKLEPLKYSKLIEKKLWANIDSVINYGDITIVDNAVPFIKTSKRLFVLWHGFGWKGPDDREAFAFMQKSIALWWGDPTKPNRNFKWQCFGKWDSDFRAKVSGFHQDNHIVAGSAYHDIAKEKIDKTKIQEFYPFDIINKKTILLAPTWHYEGIFAHWGDESEILNNIVQLISSKNTNLILRMHDSWRYPKEYLEKINKIIGNNPNILLKFKDSYQDNTVDLRMCDVLITNFSSIANLFYASNKPVIHIYPVKDANKPFLMKKLWLGKVKKKELPNVKFLWKLPPEENGGLVSYSEEELLEQIKIALDNPDCCKKQCHHFLNKYMMSADGNCCERIYSALTYLK